IMSRQFVFTLQMILAFFIIFFLIRFLRNNEGIELKDQVTKKQNKIGDYFTLLRGGVKFTFSSKSTFLMIIGIASHDLMLNIWSSLLLLPLFFAYTGTDLLISIMRTIIWVSIFPLNVYVAKVSKRLSNNNLSLVIALHGTFLFMGWILVLFFIPFNNSFNLIGMLGVMLIAISVNGTLLGLISIIRRRIMIDLVPTEIRNSVYSLIPTLVAILGIPILPIAGVITADFGLIGGILFSLMIALLSSFLVLVSFFLKKSESYEQNFISKTPVKPEVVIE
ncbi:MAG: hypothetical protein ACW967_03820, partial [Candidatus Hodarchaeales archaeon]